MHAKYICQIKKGIWRKLAPRLLFRVHCDGE